MSSAAEAKLGALYASTKKVDEELIILEEMGHPQPATPVKIDNTTYAIMNSHIQTKHTKSISMCFLGYEIKLPANSNPEFSGIQACWIIWLQN